MPQLNFTIPADLLDRIDAAKPNYLDRKGFLCLLLTSAIDKGLNLPAYCVGAGTQQSKGFPAVTAFDAELGRSASDASAIPTAVEAVQPEIDQAHEPKKKGGAGGKRSPYSVKAISIELIPDDLLDCQQLLPEFWAVKKGTRSEGVWNRVCNKLRQWTPEQRREALERAIASGWGDVFEPPSLKAVAGNSGYVDSITRDRIEREKFLAMFSSQEAA